MGVYNAVTEANKEKKFFVYSTVNLNTLINPLKQVISTKRKTSVPTSQKTHPVSSISNS